VFLLIFKRADLQEMTCNLLIPMLHVQPRQLVCTSIRVHTKHTQHFHESTHDTPTNNYSSLCRTHNWNKTKTVVFLVAGMLLMSREYRRRKAECASFLEDTQCILSCIYDAKSHIACRNIYMTNAILCDYLHAKNSDSLHARWVTSPTIVLNQNIYVI